jgi:hypothetical protein
MLKLGTNLLINEYMSLIIRLMADSRLSQSSRTMSYNLLRTQERLPLHSIWEQYAGLG